MTRLLTVLAILCLVGCGMKNDEQALQGAIAEMVTLIDAGQQKTLLSEHVYYRSSDGIRSELPADRLLELREALARAQSLRPAFSENNTLAEYDSALFRWPLWFVKVGDRWLLLDGRPNVTK